jgi:DnaK suppressor protein
MAGNIFSEFTPYKEKKGEEYMNEAQKDHFRSVLEGWKQSIVTEIQKTVSNLQGEQLNLPDMADRASQEEEFALELRARDREAKLLRKIDKSIRLIDDDDYGFCDSCGVEIGIRRLEARPTADLCIECKELEEIKERTYAA